MPMSEDELRRLRELEEELVKERRLVTLARHLGSASVDTGLRRTSTLWKVGGGIGLILIIAAVIAHSIALGAAAVIVLAATQMIVGVALIMVEVRGYRREQRWSRDKHPLT